MKGNDRREFLKQAGSALMLGAVGTAALLQTEERAEATGTYRNCMGTPYYAVYPFPRYALTFEGEAGYEENGNDTPPDYYVIYVQDQYGNNICGPYTKFSGAPDYVGAYAISITLCGPLTAGSIRTWVRAYWGTYYLDSMQTYGQNTNPTPNATIPCYSGCMSPCG